MLKFIDVKDLTQFEKGDLEEEVSDYPMHEFRLKMAQKANETSGLNNKVARGTAAASDEVLFGRDEDKKPSEISQGILHAVGEIAEITSEQKGKVFANLGESLPCLGEFGKALQRSLMSFDD